MSKKNRILGAVIGCSLSTVALAEGNLQDAFKEGSVSGNIRAHYNTWDYGSKTDQTAFSLGGLLKAETGSIGGAKFGLGYYTAQDLDTNDSDPAKIDGRMGSDLEVLGEAYIAMTAADSVLTIGRQKISTPFANPGDAFIIPVTFQGTSFTNKSIDDLTLTASYLTAIKNRNSEEFVGVGEFSTARYGVGSQNTDGTLILGSTYKSKGLGVQAWYYQFSDLFDTTYFQANYTFAGTETIKPFVAAQLASQSDSGDKLLGDVDSTLWGLQGGISMGKAKVTLGYNSIAEETTAFKNGAFLAPYNFSTSPLFTNNMLSTVENANAGEATKLTFNYSLPNTKLKLSYATFNFESNAVDKDEVDFDVTHSLGQFAPGLSVRLRIALVTSDTKSAETTNNRFQIQYAF
ncbi:MAG: hypothetical protein ACI9T9_003014 [Oleiphilaceae bacterium]|jgi:hypothetical protein